MVRTREISEEVRKLIIQDRNEGSSYGMIAKKFKVSKNGVVRICKKAQLHESAKNLPGRGRKRKTSARVDQRILREVKKNPEITAREIKETLSLTVSTKTIKRRIKDTGLKSHLKLKKPLISKKNKVKRLEFAKKYINKPAEFWESVVWSDESKFEIFGSKRRKRVWRKSNEALNPRMVQSTVKHGGGNVLVWGCFSNNGVGNLTRIEGKMTGPMYVNILQENLNASVQKMGLENFTFQQDNDPKHTSKVAKKYFEDSNISLLDWPAQSPDMNPIENLWAYLDEKIDKTGVKNSNEYFIRLNDAWNKIDIQFLKKLVESIPRRLSAVIDARGGHTKY